MNYYLRLIKFMFVVFKLNFFKSKKSIKLTFSLTNKCNSRCKTCNIWKIKNKKDISIEDIRKFFENNNYFYWIDLTGGEVFLRDDLIEIVKIIKETQKNLFLLHIPTNSLLDKKIYKNVLDIIKMNFPKFLITVSLDGDKKMHEKLRGVKGNWDKSLGLYKKLKILKSKNFDCFFGMTVSSMNYKIVSKLFNSLNKEIIDINKTDIHYNLVHNSSLYYKNNIKGENNSNLIKIFKTISNENSISINPIKILENIYQRKIESYLSLNKFPLNNCRAGEISVFLNEYGDVYPCTMWDKKVTNLKNINYSLNNIKYNFDNKKCSQCWTPCEAYQNIMTDVFKFK